MGRVSKITEENKEPFRLFGNIDYKWYGVDNKYSDGEIKFYLRPMRVNEKARFTACEERLRKSLDYSGAYIRAGYTQKEVHCKTPKNLSNKEAAEFQKIQNEKWKNVVSCLAIDVDIQEEFATETMNIVLSCVDKVSVNGEERDFTIDMYQSITDESVIVKLVDNIKNASKITDGERLGL